MKRPGASARIAALLFVVGAAPLLAEPVQLPVDIEVRATLIKLDLRNSTVSVRIDPLSPSSLRVTDARAGESTEGFVVLEEDDAGTLLVRQPHGDEAVAPDVLIELVLGGSQKLEVMGTELDVTLDAVSDDSAAEDEGDRPSASASGSGTPSAPGANAAYKFSIHDSDAVIRGIGSIDARGSGTSFELVGTNGGAAFDISGGEISADRHSGALRVKAKGTQVSIESGSGHSVISLEDGSLRAAQGTGRLEIDARSSRVVTEAWTGEVSVQGDGLVIESLESGAPEARLRFDVRESEITVVNLKGALDAHLSGGRLTARSIGARAIVRSDGSEIAIESVADSTTLDLTDGAIATLKAVAKNADIKLEDATLTVSNVGDLTLRVTASTAEASSIRGRARVTANDADVSVDLRGSVSGSTFDLRGATVAKVSAPAPCALQVDGDENAQDRIQAGVCDVWVESKSGRTASTPRSRGPRPSIVIEAKVAAASRLEIVP